MKANDDIPQDEMLLAEALAAARARKLRWCRGKPFIKFGEDETCAPSKADAVCALGAMHIAGCVPLSTARSNNGRNMVAGLFSAQVWNGNDWSGAWTNAQGDLGESLGWAFRCAMEKP